MERDPRRLALDYLAANHVMTLATYGHDGVWAAAVFYAHRAFELYFLSADHTRHVRHIEENPRVAAAIHEQQRDWSAICGIQLEGIVTRLAGASRAEAFARYLARFPSITAEPELSAPFARVSWFRLVPDRLYFVDNRVALGHRDEIHLP
ncbi:MAG: pyridoxamine 5'-phosphate oxidase family protein [Anaerolineae bacterium]|nr:pyridoxamine 5'-phosphate oxidase family protein [Anaerolineae bacterium]